MNEIGKAVVAASVLLASTVSAAQADDKATVQIFYDLLSNPSSENHVKAFLEITPENWGSIGDYSGQIKTRDVFLQQVEGFGQLIPDLKWSVEAMHQEEGFVTVRSRATGAPVAPFFGVDGQGRSFDIMTIDVHELKDGKIVRTYHVEDWAGALQQLSGK
jgi:steroid delta-isomerase-like uncharacterized protein